MSILCHAPATHPAQQSGAVLLVTSILLFLLTLVTVNTLNNSFFELQVVTNYQDQELALEAAESALRDAENWLTNQIDRIEPNSGGSKGIWNLDSPPPVKSDIWWKKAQVFGENDVQQTLNYLSEQPRYIIEEISYDPTLFQATYRITARAKGSTPNSTVILQEEYKQIYMNIISMQGTWPVNMVGIAPDASFAMCFSNACDYYLFDLIGPPRPGKPASINFQAYGLFGNMFMLMDVLPSGVDMADFMVNYLPMPIPPFIGSIVKKPIEKALDKILPNNTDISHINIETYGMMNMMGVMDMAGSINNKICVNSPYGMNMGMFMDPGMSGTDFNFDLILGEIGAEGTVTLPMMPDWMFGGSGGKGNDTYEINFGNGFSFFGVNCCNGLFIGDAAGNDTYIIDMGTTKYPNSGGDMVMIMDMIGDDNYTINTNVGGGEDSLLMSCSMFPIPDMFCFMGVMVDMMGKMMGKMDMVFLADMAGKGFDVNPFSNKSPSTGLGLKFGMFSFSFYFKMPRFDLGTKTVKVFGIPVQIVTDPIAYALGVFPMGIGRQHTNPVATEHCSDLPERLSWRELG